MRLPKRLLPALAGCLSLLACAPAEEPPAAAEQSQGPRVVSLAPHLTELAFSAGAGERLVGVVEYSDYPDAARRIPRVGDAFNVDMERLAELAPDLILTWRSGTPKPLRERLETLGYKVLTLETLMLEDVAERLTELGVLIGDEQAASARAAAYRETLNSLRSSARGRTEVRVFYQVALEPLYTVGGGHFISEIIQLCGGRNVFADLQEPAATVSHEAVLARAPQLILADQLTLEASQATWARFSSLNAVQADMVVGVDADLVTRPTLRLADGARQICAAIDAVRQASGSGAGL